MKIRRSALTIGFMHVYKLIMPGTTGLTAILIGQKRGPPSPRGTKFSRCQVQQGGYSSYFCQISLILGLIKHLSKCTQE